MSETTHTAAPAIENPVPENLLFGADKQMEGMEPLDQAKQAIAHALNSIKDEPEWAYYAGPGTQTWSLLTEAAASLFGQPLAEVRRRMTPLATRNPREAR